MEAEEFGSEVKLRLVENDYEAFRRFQQRSTLRTYLTIVIQRIIWTTGITSGASGGHRRRLDAWGR